MCVRVCVCFVATKALGYFFNGRQFVSFEGDKSDHHPLLDSIVDAWLAGRNAEIVAANQVLRFFPN